MASASVNPKKKQTGESREPELADGKRHGSRNEFVYQMLRKSIESGELKPGDRVMEFEIAEKLKVSRTPIRDALRRLESDGILEIEPRFGLRVASLSRQSILELYTMRELLEATAARLCATFATEIEMLDLEQMLAREKQLRGDYEALAKHNRRFHEAIYHGAHNKYLEKSLHAVNDSMWLLGKSQMLDPARAEQAYEQHEQLLHAILSRDAVLAEKLALAHIQAAKKARLAALFQREST
jgi:DNA-binding GntR family transcriptional regulator